MTSILDPDRYRFDRSAYERPNYKFRCGRAATWDKPCMRGPNLDGSCGGTSACNPVKNNNGRYECRRSAIAGGPCQRGPQPDGRCSIIQPPCVPRRSLRGIRGRLSLLALGLVIAFIGGFNGLSENTLAGLSWSNPGPLTANHAGFITIDDCKLCHATHNSGAEGWFEALFAPADVSAKCASCHSFDGPARQAHNRANPDRPDLGETSCLMCHTDHKGATADIIEHDDVQCASCHEKSFTGFSRSHTKFPDRFPYDRRTAIKFDHGSHFAKHFTDARFADRAPATCISCHSQDPNQRSLVRAGFEESCAACHGDQMAQRELVVLRLPEFSENIIDRDRVVEACGPTIEEFERLIERIETLEAGDEPEDSEEDEEDEFESVSTEETSIIGAYLLDVAADDPDIYNEPMQELVLAMAEDGLSPLAELIDKRADREVASQLLAGLNPEVTKRLACAWAANLEYELPAEASVGGWYGDFLELRYRPTGHGDAVSKDWIEFGLVSAQDAEDDDPGARAIDLRDSLINPKEGVGACAKCHSVNAAAEDENILSIGWRARDVMDPGRNFQFSHGVHLNLLDARMTAIGQSGQGCRVCHILDLTADFAAGYGDFDPQGYSSNFKAIVKETCTDCHSKGNVREGCQLCHDYHRKPFFKIRISNNES